MNLLTHEAATAHNDAGHPLGRYDGDITASIQVFNPVDITELGSYEVVYAVSDCLATQRINSYVLFL